MSRRPAHQPEASGRPFAAGARHPDAKLNAPIVRRLRRWARARSQPKGFWKQLAKALDVSRAAISAAIGGRTWSHLNDVEPPVRAWRRVRPQQKRSCYPISPRRAR